MFACDPAVFHLPLKPQSQPCKASDSAAPHVLGSWARNHHIFPPQNVANGLKSVEKRPRAPHKDKS